MKGGLEVVMGLFLFDLMYVICHREYMFTMMLMGFFPRLHTKTTLALLNSTQHKKADTMSVIILFPHDTGHSHKWRSSVWKKKILVVCFIFHRIYWRCIEDIRELPFKVLLAHSPWLPGVQIGDKNLTKTWHKLWRLAVKM